VKNYSIHDDDYRMVAAELVFFDFCKIFKQVSENRVLQTVNVIMQYFILTHFNLIYLK